MLLPLVLPAVCLPAAPPITLSTDRPGNLFAVGSSATITAQAPGLESLTWRLILFGGTPGPSGTMDLLNGAGWMNFDGLPKGYYELICTAGEATAKLSFGVVSDHSAQDPADGRINVDGALSWLTPKENFEPLAQMLRMVGIGWVRERFAWWDTEREKGRVDWKQYDPNADTYARHGIRVYQIFHDSPGWTHPGNDRTRNPEDLREVYSFAKRVAEHFKGRVQAWEVWNEPDIGFWPDLGDTYAGLAKAAYLGFKAGDPDLPVLLGSFCRGYCPFDDSLFESGIRDYFDIFNWHTYSPPESYAGTLGRYLELLGQYECAGRPVWISECGIPLRATEPGGELSAEDERRQAEFVPRSFASSLAAGSDKHFWFVYPYYLENGVQFGALRKDLSPRPVFIAIAAAAEMLGQAEYLGEYRLEGVEGARALAFHGPVGTRQDASLLVIWAGKPQTVELRGLKPDAEVADLFGASRPAPVADGKLRLDIGPSPQYVLGLDDTVGTRLIASAAAPRPTGILPTNHPCPVILRGQARVDTLDKNRNCYLVGTDAFPFTVEVCNFGSSAASGEVALELPDGWTAEPASAAVSLEPMGRAVCEFSVKPSALSALSAETLKLWVRPRFAGLQVQPSVSYFYVRTDWSRLQPRETQDLGLNDPGLWRANISGNGTMKVEAGPEGGMRFPIAFTGAGDRWVYPRVDFAAPRDFSAWQGLAFEYRCHADDDQTSVRVQVYEEGGPAYIDNSGWTARREWTSVCAAFHDLSWGNWSPADPNGKLDLNRIVTLMVGMNTKRDEVALEVRNVRLVRF